MDVNGLIIRIVFLDYWKVFDYDLVDYYLLIVKLCSFGVKLIIVNWIIDFN